MTRKGECKEQTVPLRRAVADDWGLFYQFEIERLTSQIQGLVFRRTEFKNHLKQLEEFTNKARGLFNEKKKKKV